MYRISAPEKYPELKLAAPFRAISRNWNLFTMLLRNDLRTKFRHSLLGVLWLFIPPVCILLIYIYMFSLIFKMRWPETDLSSRWGFGLSIYLGITVYSAFSDSIMSGLSLMTSRSGMLKRVPFPLELLPISQVCANMVISGVVLWTLFLLSLLSGGEGSWTAIGYFPLIYLPFILLVIGSNWIVSAMGVFFRDLGNLMGILILVAFFSTPIFYTFKMVPPQYLWCIKINPITPVIINIRRIFLQNAVPDFTAIAYSWLIGVIVFQLGYGFFQRMRRRFADVI